MAVRRASPPMGNVLPTAPMLKSPSPGESRVARDRGGMHFTRPRELVVAGLIGLVLAYLAFKFFYGSLPRLPTFAGATLAALSVIEVALAFSIRSRIRTGRLLGAIAVARAVALAKASSL